MKAPIRAKVDKGALPAGKAVEDSVVPEVASAVDLVAPLELVVNPVDQAPVVKVEAVLLGVVGAKLPSK
jgi:hypothetical protein